MSYLREILAICSTAVGLFNLYVNGNGTTMTAVVAFWGVLLGAEVQARATEKSNNATG